MRQLILDKAESILKETIKDPYGNYFIQDLIDLISKSERARITAFIMENVIELGTCKYSSLVLIKLTSQISLTEFRKLYKKLFTIDKLSTWAKNKYMNAFLKIVASKVFTQEEDQLSEILDKYPFLKTLHEQL